MTAALAIRVLTLLLATSLVTIGSGSRSNVVAEDTWTESRFHTGCEPGPFHEPPPPEHLETHFPPLGTASNSATVRVNLGETLPSAPQPILGVGFNLEHALWSCPEFRGLFRSEVLDAFKPAIARVDSGLLPAAPPELSAADLGPAVYESVLSSPAYASSWKFFHRLNREGVRIVLGVSGGPGQFTEDGTRLGRLLSSHYDDYVQYVSTVVNFLVRKQKIKIWATTIANEPDGGDGNQIPPDGLAYIAHRLAPLLAEDGVKLYGPDTSNADNAMEYLPPLLDDALVSENLAFVAFHQYYESSSVQSVVDYVHQRRPGLPVVITEYTSFSFGDLDDGQEANAQTGFALDIAATLLSHFRYGVDAAIYCDAVDYLQPGHDAITKWGILRGPADDFERRPRYYGLLQILPYLQPGARVLADTIEGDDQLHELAVRTAEGVPAIFLVNQDFVPVDVTLNLSGAEASRYADLSVTRTQRDRFADRVGRLRLEEGEGRLTVPPRSITTLFPSGAGPQPDDTALAPRPTF